MTEQTLFILASLAGGERHGYAIAGEVGTLSEGRIRLTAGTLYGALTRLAESGLVEASGEERVDGRRRRYYRITGAGQSALAEQVAHLQATVRAVAPRAGAAPA
ncbi:PadR family transcriptional regulator [Nocardioides sp. YIM 152315]|uniref:PadR family transcriptional regulator n=1 Tax=Nocardioides sp. YIM 152315 TaxID=3031760 RepID=UPI0023DB3798|nr:PadR family transcriptional regulator [Nocardioides sp. YIM 152315]MDF1605701.1 PadR family transcriptional regulator [Nocardioides sp. YIM 152315]